MSACAHALTSTILLKNSRQRGLTDPMRTDIRITRSRVMAIKGYSRQPAYSGPPAYGSPGNSEYPAYSGGPAHGYQARPPSPPYSGSGDGVTSERPLEDWSPGAKLPREVPQPIGVASGTSKETLRSPPVRGREGVRLRQRKPAGQRRLIDAGRGTVLPGI
jgi:hypothetical protein